MQPLGPLDPQRLGPYQLAGRIGRGGMGDVYLGVSPTADRFAVKVIHRRIADDQDYHDRFVAEVEALRAIIGNRIARLQDADLADAISWFAVEYIPGRTLQQHVEASGPLPLREGAMVGAMLVDGLRQIHQGGRLHRDLKPSNIMLSPDGPVVIDFGLAVLQDREHHLTPAGQPVGTPAYMPPEQARGDEEITKAADVYALGATLVFALTGHPAYPPANAYATVARVKDPNDLPDASGVPTELSSLIRAMLAFDPGSRPLLEDVYLRLLEVATAEGVSANEIRIRVASQTFNPAWNIAIPAELDVPVEDPEDIAPPPGSADSLPTVEPSAEDNGDDIKLDVNWLVDELRSSYARRASL